MVAGVWPSMDGARTGRRGAKPKAACAPLPSGPSAAGPSPANFLTLIPLNYRFSGESHWNRGVNCVANGPNPNPAAWRSDVLFECERNADPVDYSADDAAQYAVSVHGVSHRLPAIAGLRCGPGRPVDRSGAQVTVCGGCRGYSSTGEDAGAKSTGSPRASSLSTLSLTARPSRRLFAFCKVVIRSSLTGSLPDTTCPKGRALHRSRTTSTASRVRAMRWIGRLAHWDCRIAPSTSQPST